MKQVSRLCHHGKKTDRDNGTKYLFFHSHGLWIFGQNDSGLYEIPLRVIGWLYRGEDKYSLILDEDLRHTSSTYEDFSVSIFSLLDIFCNLLKGRLSAKSILWSMIERDYDEISYITGPMKFLKSWGGPTLIFAVSDRSRSLKPLFQTEDATYKRDRAEHFWPALLSVWLRILRSEWPRYLGIQNLPGQTAGQRF